MDNANGFTPVSVQLTDEKIRLFRFWFAYNEIMVDFYYGKYYFQKEEDASAFKLTFGDMLHA